MTAKQLATLAGLLLEYATLVATSDTVKNEMIQAAVEAVTRLQLLLSTTDSDTLASDIPF